MSFSRFVDRLTGKSAIISFRMLVVTIILTVAAGISVGFYYLTMEWRAELDAQAALIKGEAEARVIQMKEQAKTGTLRTDSVRNK